MDSTSSRTDSTGLSRRDFLARGSALAVSAAVGVSALRSGQTSAEGTDSERAKVVRVRSEGVLRGLQVDQRVLEQMLSQGLKITTGAPTAAEAWHTLLESDDVVGLKFNQSASRELGTTGDMAAVLIRSLTAAGFEASRIVPLEVPEAVYHETGTLRPVRHWSREEVSFGSGRDRLADVLEQVTAIVNVPFLKTHNIAGLTCCLKNLSHALVKHPARFHEGHCSPYIADIVALPQIRSKLRLHVVDALRMVYDGGPEARAGSIAEGGMLLLGTDPVALDTIALEEINLKRINNGRQPIRPGDGLLDYLPQAAAHGLGCDELHRIELIKVVV